MGTWFGLYGPGLHSVVAWANPCKGGVFFLLLLFILRFNAHPPPTDEGAHGKRTHVAENSHDRYETFSQSSLLHMGP